MAVGRKREEAVIRRLIEDWAAAVRARKISAVVAHHTDDVVMLQMATRRERHVRHRQVEHHGRRQGCVRHGLAAVWFESGAGKRRQPAPAFDDWAAES
jgi:hypothetical protein